MPAAAADSSYVFSNSSPEFSQATKTNGSQAFSAPSKGPGDAANLQLDSDPICSSAGCTQYKAPKVDTHPMDYFVPNFGMDHNIKDSIEDEKVASKLVGHGWAFKTPESWEKYRIRAKDTMYNFDPELDENMKVSLKNIKNAEMAVGPDFSIF